MAAINTVSDLITALQAQSLTAQVRDRGLYIQSVKADSTGVVQISTLANVDETEPSDVNP